MNLSFVGQWPIQRLQHTRVTAGNYLLMGVLHQKETLVNEIKKKRLTWFGHVSKNGRKTTAVKSNALPYRRDSEVEI